MKFFLLLLCLIYAPSGFSQHTDSLIKHQFDLLINASLKCLDNELYREAQNLTNTAEQLVRDSLPSPHTLLGNCFFNRARIYRRKRDFDSAVLWYSNSKEIWANTIGKNHPLYLNAIYQMGLMYREMNAFEKALFSFKEQKEILIKTVSNTDSSYIECLNSLGLAYMDLEEFKKAEVVFMEAYTKQLKNADTLHPQIANTLSNQALLFKKTGNFEEALVKLKKALAIRARNPGKRSLIYTISLGNLASLYKEIGNYENAEDVYLEAWELRKETFGETHMLTLGSLENLAGLYKEIGDTDKAINLYKRVIAGRKMVLGSLHSVYGIGLNHLANTYREINKPLEALPVYKEAILVRAKNLPTYQKEYVETLNHLTAVYIALDSFDIAMRHCKSTLQFCDSVFGKSNTLFADGLSQLGLLEIQLGYCNEAEQHFREASVIYKQNLGKDHYRYAESLELLGNLHFDLGQYDKAEPLLLQAKKIKEKILGNKHALYLKSLDQLGEFYELQKKYSASDPLFSELSEADQERLSTAAGFLTEKELEHFTQSFQQRSDKLGNYILHRNKQLKDKGNLSAFVLNNNLFYKGFLLTSAIQLNKLASVSSESLKLNAKLKNLKRALGRAYLDPDSQAKYITQWEDEANVLEKDLRKLLNGFTSAYESIKWEKIQNALSETEAAIEFIHFKDITDTVNNSIQYAAIVIKKSLKSPQFIPLFEERALASLMPTNAEFQSEIISSLYKSHRGAQKKLSQKKPDLYELIWEPLDSVLKNVKTVYYSPSGVLHRFNINAIPVNPIEILSDRYEMINVNSTRQLASTIQIYSPNKNALLLGGIDYEASLDLTQEQNPNIQQAAQNVVPDSENFESWGYLPGTEKEVDSIRVIMLKAGINVQLQKGPEATEANFKSFGQDGQESPQIIQLATHGYFYQTKTKSVNRTNNISSPEKSQEPIFITSANPMFRSGLILSGGNAAWQGKNIPSHQEDGILTAYEISQLNLSNTELVVLSACETGLGDIRGSEGVYGLQRAFRVAGVKHLIMSLWKVPDLSTYILMQEFYKNWLLDYMTIPAAFYTAQKFMRDKGYEAHQWAGFVLVQ
ncbi:MAG: CHAT domain-containing protein [Saprospiraceae bacterium]|nr:CHAT domain-containing protein [Saprospiraceae bacterium]